MGIASTIALGREDADHVGSGHSLSLDDLWEHHDYLHSIAWRIVGDSATAEDVVQETYVRALRHLDDLDPDQSVRGWLATVTRRLAIDEVRRARRHAVPIEEIPERGGQGHGHELTDAIVQRETLDAARTALASLPDRERRLLVLRVTEGRSIADLAHAEGSTPRAVESVLSRARAKLSAALERGAAAFLPPFAAAARWFRRPTESAPAEPGLLGAARRGLGARGVELAAAGTAAAVLAAAFMVGGQDTPATARVEMTGEHDAPDLSLPLGVDDADRLAAFDRAAALRQAQLLPAAVADLLGIPEKDREPDDDVPGDDDHLPRGAAPGGFASEGGEARSSGPGKGVGGRDDNGSTPDRQIRKPSVDRETPTISALALPAAPAAQQRIELRNPDTPQTNLHLSDPVDGAATTPEMGQASNQAAPGRLDAGDSILAPAPGLPAPSPRLECGASQSIVNAACSQVPAAPAPAP